MNNPKKTIITTQIEVEYITYNGANILPILLLIGEKELIVSIDDVGVPYLVFLTRGLKYTLKKNDTLAKFSTGEVEIWDLQKKIALVGDEPKHSWASNSSKDNNIRGIFTNATTIGNIFEEKKND